MKQVINGVDKCARKAHIMLLLLLRAMFGILRKHIDTREPYERKRNAETDEFIA